MMCALAMVAVTLAANGEEQPAYTSVVHGKSAPQAPAVASDVRIELGLLRERPRDSSTGLLLLAPGVFLAQHSGEGHAPQIFLRGFDAGEGKDLEMRLEGVPLNDVSHAHSHGYADTSFLIPELVSAIRVTEGPFLASQGDFAVAGSLDFELSLKQRGFSLVAEHGRFNQSRLTALWGPADAKETTFVGVSGRQGSGFGPNRAFAQASLLASHEFRLGEARLRLLAGVSAGRFESAGVLRLDTVERRSNSNCEPTPEAQFFCFTDPNQGGGQQRHFVSAELTQKLEKDGTVRHQLFATYRDMRLRENFTGYLNDIDTGQPQRGDTLELRYHGLTAGIRGSWAQRLGAKDAQRRPTLELGYLGRFDTVESSSRRLRFADGVPYRQLFDNQLRITNIGLYAQATVPLGARFTLLGGLRVDAFFFGVTDRARPLADRTGPRLSSDTIEAFGFVPMPRVALEVALAEHFSWMTGFGIGGRSSDAAALSDSEFAPFALVGSVETGLRYRRAGPLVKVEVRGAAFATRVERDIVFDADQGRNVTVGRSNRVGVFAYTRLTIGQSFDVTASTSYTRGHLPPEGSPWLAVFDGPALPYVPRFLARLEAVAAHQFMVARQLIDVTAGLAWWVIGPRPLPFNRLTEPAMVVDASARLRWKQVSFGLAVDNLLDTRWRQAEYNYVSNFQGPEALPSRLVMRHFAAAPPRAWRLMLGVHFD
jgi:iron complex outermembrane recepter protein